MPSRAGSPQKLRYSRTDPTRDPALRRLICLGLLVDQSTRDGLRGVDEAKASRSSRLRSVMSGQPRPPSMGRATQILRPSRSARTERPLIPIDAKFKASRWRTGIEPAGELAPPQGFGSSLTPVQPVAIRVILCGAVGRRVQGGPSRTAV